LADDFIVRLELDARDAQGSAKQLANALGLINEQLGGTDKGLNAAERAMAKAAGTEARAADAAKKHSQSLSTTRYALQDVSSTLGIAGAALVGLTVATVAAGVAWERDFANVIRTSGLSGDATGIAQLREEFVKLAQTLPLASSELAEIGTLGGQLGIDASGLSEFTTVVAKLAATTDLSSEAAGTALGRFQALLGVDSSSFDNLASSILKVGVNSVATETQIVNISTQISSMADYAGFTAEQVVGLSGALASVGAQPELSRGTITRTFTLISQAVSKGGDDLDAFANIAGVSSQQFASAFGTDKFAPIFEQFLTGLGDMQRNGEDANQAIRNLGITSVRDVPLLLRLGLASDVVKRSFADAATGFREGTELNEQYGIIAETTASRLQILGNNFNQFLAALSGGALGPLSDFLDFMSQTLIVVTDFTSTPIGSNLAGFGLGLTAVVGVLALVFAALSRVAAGAIAMKQAFGGISDTFPGFTGKLATISKAIGGIGIALAGLQLVRVFLDGADAAAANVVQVDKLRNGLSEMTREVDAAQSGGFLTNFLELQGGLNDNYVDVLKRATGANRFFGESLRPISDLLGGIPGKFTGLDQAVDSTKELDTAFAALVEQGQADVAAEQYARWQKAAEKAGIGMDGLKEAFPQYTEAISAFNVVGGLLPSILQEVAPNVNLITDEMDAAEVAATNLATQLGLVPEELKTLNENLTTGSAGFINWSTAIEKSTSDSGFSLSTFSGELTKQTEAQQEWADNLQILAGRGALGFVSELAKLGPEGAAVAAAAVNATADELDKLEDQARLAAFLSSAAFADTFTNETPKLIAAYKAGGTEAVKALITALREGPAQTDAVIQQYNIKLAQTPITPKVDYGPALAALDTVRRAINGLVDRSYTANVRVATGPGGAGGITKADGGYIRGPGTGTSDSIPAWLSNGEYVVKAASVRKYGTGFLNALNQGRAPKFASGGQVGGGSSGSGLGSMVELGPKSLGRLGGGGNNIIVLDDQAIARAANRGNAQIRNNGG
jgi:TP901 family phage tail tape measure protein